MKMLLKREILILDDEENELILPKSEQIPTDYFKKGDNVRAVVLETNLEKKHIDLKLIEQ